MNSRLNYNGIKILALPVILFGILLAPWPATAQVRADSGNATPPSEVELQLRQAEQRLEESAQQIAELSGEQLARFGKMERRFVVTGGHPVLGITIGSGGGCNPVEGVTVLGVSPGGAADEAHLRSGDIITAINGESFSSSSGNQANDTLLEFMQGVEEGDVLSVDYLRDNKPENVELTPRKIAGWDNNLDMGFDRPGIGMPGMKGAPHTQFYAWVNRNGGHGFGEMEMVELNKSLGRYFGTDTGLLIVKAPKDNAYQLEDGDVIRNIDGRTPNNLNHAIRILSSYQSGETVNIEIMRDKRKKMIKVEVPDNRRSHEFRVPAVAPLDPVIMVPGKHANPRLEVHLRDDRA